MITYVYNYKSGDVNKQITSQPHHNSDFIISGTSFARDYNRNSPSHVSFARDCNRNSPSHVSFSRDYNRNSPSHVSFDTMNFPLHLDFKDENLSSNGDYDLYIFNSLQHQALSSLIFPLNLYSYKGDTCCINNRSRFSYYHFPGDDKFINVFYESFKTLKLLSSEQNFTTNDFGDNIDVFVEKLSITEFSFDYVSVDDVFKNKNIINELIKEKLNSEDEYNSHLCKLIDEFKKQAHNYLLSSSQNSYFRFKSYKFIIRLNDNKIEVCMPKVLNEDLYHSFHDDLVPENLPEENHFFSKFPGDNREIPSINLGFMKESEADEPLYITLNRKINDVQDHFLTLRFNLWLLIHTNNKKEIAEKIPSLFQEIEKSELVNLLADFFYFEQNLGSAEVYFNDIFKNKYDLLTGIAYKLLTCGRVLEIRRFELILSLSPPEYKVDLAKMCADKLRDNLDADNLNIYIFFLKNIGQDELSSYLDLGDSFDLYRHKDLSLLKDYISLKYKAKSNQALLRKVEIVNKELLGRFLCVLLFMILLNKVVPFTSAIFILVQSVVATLNIFFSLSIGFSTNISIPVVAIVTINMFCCILAAILTCDSIDNLFVSDDRIKNRENIFCDYNIIYNDKVVDNFGLFSWLFDRATISAFFTLIWDIIVYIPKAIRNSYFLIHSINKVNSVIRSEENSLSKIYDPSKEISSENLNILKKIVFSKGISEAQLSAWIKYRRQP